MTRKRRKRIGAVYAVLVVFGLMAGTAYGDTGADVSNWQGCINASRAASAKRAGVNFSFVKTTEGTTFVDRYADCSMNGFASAGIRRGVYHFARPERSSAVAEANFFISHTRGYVHKGIIPVLDWEPTGNYKRNVQWAKTWLDTVARAWGTKPMIYMSASTIKMADWSLVASADYGLWVAGYPRGYAGDRLRNPGSVPYSVAPWKFAAAWQYSSSGNVAGIGNAVDVNFFYGDAVTWAKYANAPLPHVNVGSTSVPKASQPVASADVLASAVIRGDYGNDPRRRVLLGSRYSEVMRIVNQRMGVGSVVSSGRVHIVRRGESLYSIFGRDWQRVARLNGLRNPNLIYPNQRLRF